MLRGILDVRQTEGVGEEGAKGNIGCKRKGGKEVGENYAVRVT